MDNPLVSVIVPTFNSERFLEACLRSINRQIYGNIEVIIVDNYSTDKTRKIAQRYGVGIVESRAKRSQARNIGARKAAGELVFFVDSDMEVDCIVVGECVRKIGEGYNGLIVPEVSVGEGFWARCKALEKACYVGDDLIEAARFFERSVFEDVGGYDEKLEAGEDWDLHLRVKNSDYSVARIGAVIRHLEGNPSLHDFLLKKYRYGKTLSPYLHKHRSKAQAQLRAPRLAFLKNWKTLVRQPLYSSGMLLMKTCELLSIELGHLTA